VISRRRRTGAFALVPAYHSYQLFLEFPDAFEKLKRAPFWKDSRQRPKDLTTSRFIACLIAFFESCVTQDSFTRCIAAL
jgi:hypothetical protein